MSEIRISDLWGEGESHAPVTAPVTAHVFSGLQMRRISSNDDMEFLLQRQRRRLAQRLTEFSGLEMSRMSSNDNMEKLWQRQRIGLAQKLKIEQIESERLRIEQIQRDEGGVELDSTGVVLQEVPDNEEVD